MWHRGLLFKLQKAGVHGPLLRWFENYLINRCQRVCIRGQHSLTGYIKAGVPQGSVLGPLLFLIYINDLTNVTFSKMKLFADDTSLYIDFDNADQASAIINEDLKSIQDWANQWLVKFSPTKTKLMTCSNKKRIYPDIKFDNVVLKSVDSHKHLGLTLAKNLTWSGHVSNILKSVSPMTDVLKKLKYDLDRKTLETTYFSFIRPKLEYGSHIWDNCSQRDTELLENFQLEIARIVTGARKGTSHELLYKETNWPTLKERRNMNKLKNFVKIISNQTPQYLHDILPEKIGLHRPMSRNPYNFILPATRTETYRSSFIPSATRIWNKLPQNKRSIETVIKENASNTSRLFYEGKRSVGIKHVQLRMKCSKLNADLFSLHVIDSPQCPCGHFIEDVDHFFFNCPLYIVPRQHFINALTNIIEDDHIDTKTSLYGNDNYDYNVNKRVFNLVHNFVTETNRL